MILNKKNISLLTFLLLLSLISLEMSFGFSGRKVGTVLVVSISFLIISIFFLKASKNGVLVSFSISDFVFLVLITYIAISAFWSVNPSETLFQASFWLIIWFAVKCIGVVETRVVVGQFVYLAVGIAIISIVLIPFAPNIAFQPKPSGTMPELRGLFHHQLRFGLFNALALGLLVIMKLNNELQGLLKNKLVYFLVFILISFALVMSFARLYTFFAILSFFMIFVIALTPWKRRLIISFIFLFITLILVSGDFILLWLEGVGVDTTLTGRVRIWQVSIDIASNNWLYGTGFSTFQNQDFDYLWGIYRPAHPHNSFIQAYFELGVIGLISCLFLIYYHYKNVVQENFKNRLKYSYSTFVYFLTVFGSLTGANYVTKPTLIFCLLLILIELEKNQKIKLIL
jgi:exopolysaccharide production protein ExoQ